VALTRCDLAGFADIEPQWDALAAEGESPFLTAAWLGSWWRAFAPEEAVALVLRDEDGSLLAGGLFRESGGELRAAVNAHTNDWNVVAADSGARSRFWSEVGEMRHRRIALAPLLDGDDASMPAAILRDHGCHVVEKALEPSPWLELPGSLDDLLAARSRNLRSQVGRRRRALEKEGDLAFRVVTDAASIDQDLDALLALEASGWKGKGGTAIAGDAALVAHYRAFAETAAAQGWLRLYMLELNEKLIAADYGCVFRNCGYLIKTAYDEDLGRFAPGLVLRAAVLGASIEEGLERYDLLGGPDGYKLRWADKLRGRSAIRGFRGARAAPAYAWHSSLRPALKGARDRAKAAFGRAGR
jgi:CelD/BcsL family acetyltransferase involved in cellulose biosynthesis